MPDVDGRRLRREQNRLLVVEALVALYAEGSYDPSAAEVAERAGLSPRSLFRYFDDTDDLARAAVAHHLALARPLLDVDVDPDAPLDQRLLAVARQRIRLWEAVGPSARVARMRAPGHPVLAAELRRNRAGQRRQLGRLLAPELAALGRGGGRRALAAADVLCSFEAYDLLRHDQELSPEQVVAAVTEGLAALLR